MAQTEGQNEAHLLTAGLRGRERACLNLKHVWDCRASSISRSWKSGDILLGEANSRAGGVSHGGRKRGGHPRRSLERKDQESTRESSGKPVSDKQGHFVKGPPRARLLRGKEDA